MTTMEHSFAAMGRALDRMARSMTELFIGKPGPADTLDEARGQLDKAVRWSRLTVQVPKDERQAIALEARDLVRAGLTARFGVSS